MIMRLCCVCGYGADLVGGGVGWGKGRRAMPWGMVRLGFMCGWELFVLSLEVLHALNECLDIFLRASVVDGSAETTD